MSTFIAFKAHSAGVGKFIGNSKIKYEWFFAINNDLFALVLLVSKYSKKHRVILCNKLICEDVVGQDYYYFKILIDGKTLEIQKDNKGTYLLYIDRESYDKLSLSTSNNSSFDEHRKRNPGLGLFGNFSVEAVGKYYKLVRADKASSHPESNQQIPSYPDLPSGRNLPEGKTVFASLDDSEELYKHDFLYLFIKEQNEDLELVNVVNNVQ
jgi:hypothetical protein